MIFKNKTQKRYINTPAVVDLIDIISNPVILTLTIIPSKMVSVTRFGKQFKLYDKMYA